MNAAENGDTDKARSLLNSGLADPNYVDAVSFARFTRFTRARPFSIRHEFSVLFSSLCITRTKIQHSRPLPIEDILRLQQCSLKRVQMLIKSTRYVHCRGISHFFIYWCCAMPFICHFF
jgi:hypothetical protein